MSPSFDFEREHWQSGLNYVAGLDEAGRGCLAGPVVAAAVILPPNANLPGLNDSKKLSPRAREALMPIIAREALAIGIGQCSPSEIDQFNILHASLEAMRRATADLILRPNILLIDGNRAMKDPPCPQHLIVRGDSKCVSIAAASVVAKVFRDRLMKDLDSMFPLYGHAKHKGYPTAAHYGALATYGATAHHRRSFRLVR